MIFVMLKCYIYYVIYYVKQQNEAYDEVCHPLFCLIALYLKKSCN